MTLTAVTGQFETDRADINKVRLVSLRRLKLADITNEI
jgi:hypothetical protein